MSLWIEFFESRRIAHEFSLQKIISPNFSTDVQHFLNGADLNDQRRAPYVVTMTESIVPMNTLSFKVNTALVNLFPSVRAQSPQVHNMTSIRKMKPLPANRFVQNHVGRLYSRFLAISVNCILPMIIKMLKRQNLTSFRSKKTGYSHQFASEKIWEALNSIPFT